ncbi:MAG TPA: rod shape-determining protein MreC [Candidatus Pelethosoma merdigallinarum]|nr:rod shape-determining protein MreC [Candidatus Pelethosoma merdigallinarum]
MLNGRKKIEKKYILLGIVVAIVLLLVLVSAIVMNKRNLSPVEMAIKDSVLLVQKVAYAPIRFVKDKMTEISKLHNIYEEYQILENKVQETDSIKAKNAELEDEVDKLQKTLELNQVLSKDAYLNATVVNRNLGYWYNTITIDKGSKNGVKVDMPVVVSEGLIGKVSKVTNFNSTVKLLTSDDVNNKISVKISVDGKNVYGLLSGYDKSSRSFIVEGIADNTEIKEGDMVLTTGMGDIFPSGILVGKVSKITKDNFDLARTVEVKSDVNFDDIRYVTILKRQGEES